MVSPPPNFQQRTHRVQDPRKTSPLSVARSAILCSFTDVKLSDSDLACSDSITDPTNHLVIKFFRYSSPLRYAQRRAKVSFIVSLPRFHRNLNVPETDFPLYLNSFLTNICSFGSNCIAPVRRDDQGKNRGSPRCFS